MFWKLLLHVSKYETKQGAICSQTQAVLTALLSELFQNVEMTNIIINMI